jgi:outer membrane protein insertion porin family
LISSDALGGNKYYLGSVALTVPLGLPKELGITGSVFSDFGTLFSNDQKNLVLNATQLATNNGVQPQIQDSAAVRASVGFGIAWKSPVGPIRVDLAVPIKKESFDQSQLFHVSFGTKF